ncbi:MAG TPA: hypothetical protein O0X43_02395 [Methanocorpusculum sp.]|nr:hypothetical protein [Methanocorpusculum sp.]
MDDDKELQILTDLAATRQQLDNICRQTGRIYQKQEEQDEKLNELALKIESLETQNRVLKWIIGSLLSAAAIAVAWIRGPS